MEHLSLKNQIKNFLSEDKAAKDRAQESLSLQPLSALPLTDVPLVDHALFLATFPVEQSTHKDVAAAHEQFKRRCRTATEQELFNMICDAELEKRSSTITSIICKVYESFYDPSSFRYDQEE
ncbi:hypothetical protein GF367_01580 [Candidatus Woesearchaeota archaeon]|nr:hypothetical protein [Candidatus Woesearchaeota archaeon]